MKPLFVMTLVLVWTAAHAQNANNNNNNNSSVAVFARVDPTGVTASGTGIRGVTFTNLTQNTTAIVQSFFAAGGVGPQPNPQTQAATISASGSVFANSPAKGLNDYRTQLTGERLRLVQVIKSTRRDRQSSVRETARLILIERAIQQADRQIALQESSLKIKSAPSLAGVSH